MGQDLFPQGFQSFLQTLALLLTGLRINPQKDMTDLGGASFKSLLMRLIERFETLIGGLMVNVAKPAAVKGPEFVEMFLCGTDFTAIVRKGTLFAAETLQENFLLGRYNVRILRDVVLVQELLKQFIVDQIVEDSSPESFAVPFRQRKVSDGSRQSGLHGGSSDGGTVYVRHCVLDGSGVGAG